MRCFLIYISAFSHLIQVDIGLLHDLPHANMVMAEPVTPDDWEIVVR